MCLACSACERLFRARPEMHNGRALFPGESDEAQIDLIFRKLGTPTEEIFPTITALPQWAVRTSLVVLTRAGVRL